MDFPYDLDVISIIFGIASLVQVQGTPGTLGLYASLI